MHILYDEPDVSENNRGSQGLDEGDRVAFYCTGVAASGMVSELLHY